MEVSVGTQFQVELLWVPETERISQDSRCSKSVRLNSRGSDEYLSSSVDGKALGFWGQMVQYGWLDSDRVHAERSEGQI